MITKIGVMGDRLLSLVVPRTAAAAQQCSDHSTCTRIACCGTGPCTRRNHYRCCAGGCALQGTSCTCGP